MNTRIADKDVQKAYSDLWQRTLSKISGELNRLIYLASTRDYNSGRYHHAGLENCFGYEAVSEALETAHREIFGKLTGCALEELVSELELYIRSSKESPEQLLGTWRTLQPYRIAIPMGVHPMAAHLFLSNLKLALEVLLERRSPHPQHP